VRATSTCDRPVRGDPRCTPWLAMMKTCGPPICATGPRLQDRRVAPVTTLPAPKHFCIDNNPMHIGGTLTRWIGGNGFKEPKQASPNAVRECVHSRRLNPRKSFNANCRPQGHGSGPHRARQLEGGGRTEFVQSKWISSIPAPNVAWERRLKPLVVVAKAPLSGRSGQPADL
jgi:hypothetical protein